MKYLLICVFFTSIFYQPCYGQLGSAPHPRNLDRTTFSSGVFEAEIVQERTGFTGVCVDCQVEEAECLVDSDCERRFGTHFSITTGAQNTGTISALALDTIFPAGTYAGWTHYYEGAILATDWDALVGPLAVATYLDGAFQEGREVDNRNLVTGLGIFTSTESHFVELATTKPFNEVQIIVDFGAVSNIEFARIPSIYVGTGIDNDGDGYDLSNDSDDHNPCVPDNSTNACQSNSALDVEWIDFTATVMKQGVQLDWSIEQANELNYFTVERQTATENIFTEVEKIVAQKGSQQGEYQYVDTKISNGIYQYRLKLIDNDGRITYSPIRVVKVDKRNRMPFTIIQNPVMTATLKLAIQIPIIIEIYNTQGHLVRAEYFATTGNQELMLNGLGAGMYYVKGVNESGNWIEKIIVP